MALISNLDSVVGFFGEELYLNVMYYIPWIWLDLAGVSGI